MAAATALPIVKLMMAAVANDNNDDDDNSGGDNDSGGNCVINGIGYDGSGNYNNKNNNKPSTCRITHNIFNLIISKVLYIIYYDYSYFYHYLLIHSLSTSRTHIGTLEPRIFTFCFQPLKSGTGTSGRCRFCQSSARI